MKPPRNANQLLENLDEDFAWRLQEVASIRKAIRNSSDRNQATLLRAAVPLLYAHWEGFVKTAALQYAAYISGLGITFREARKSFSGLKALSYVKQLHPINKRIFVASKLLAALHAVEGEKLVIPLESYITNVGNLNYDIFEQILEFLSLDTSSYAAKKQLIDESLLEKRNDIAHGDYLLIDPDGFESLSDEILQLMRLFKTDIQNGAVSKDYLREEPSRTSCL